MKKEAITNIIWSKISQTPPQTMGPNIGSPLYLNSDISTADLHNADILDTPTQYYAKPLKLDSIAIDYIWELSHFCFHYGSIFLPSKILGATALTHLTLIISLLQHFYQYVSANQKDPNSPPTHMITLIFGHTFASFWQ